MMRLVVVVVDVLLLQVRRGSMDSAHFVVVVAVLEILHLKQVIIATLFLVAMLLMNWLSSCRLVALDHLLLSLLLLGLLAHLNHVISLRFGACPGLKGRQSVYRFSHFIVRPRRTVRVVGGEGRMLGGLRLLRNSW
jgi:hypothetical protein